MTYEIQLNDEEVSIIIEALKQRFRHDLILKIGDQRRNQSKVSDHVLFIDELPEGAHGY